MKYDKLVRDKIPYIIMQEGRVPITRIASDEEYWEKLKEKLNEEVAEFHTSESPEELADILEVISAICAHKNIDLSHLQHLQLEKAGKRGGFRDRVILEETQDSQEK